MPGIPALQTDRLTIRPVTGNDFDVLHEIHERAFGDGSHYRAEEAMTASRKTLSWIELNEWSPRLRWWNTRLIEVTELQKVIGEVAFVPMPLPVDALIAGSGEDANMVPQAMELSMLWGLLPEYRRIGCATEAVAAMIGFAFQQFNLRRIVADTEHENLASQGVMRRVGMTLYQNKLAGIDWLETVGVLVNPSFA